MKKTQTYNYLICPMCNFTVDQDTGFCLECGIAGVKDLPDEQELDFSDNALENYIKEVDKHAN